MHAQAAGVGIKKFLITKLISQSNEDLKEYDFGTTYYEVNFIKNASDSTLDDLIYSIDKYKPIYGQGCPEPLIAITDINISKKDIQVMGSNKDTVKITYNGISYMFFKAKDFIDKINNLDYNAITLEIVGRGNINNWMGSLTPQIFVLDYNIYDTRLMF